MGGGNKIKRFGDGEENQKFEKKKERKKERKIETRPDTRPPVADGWAGAEMRVFTLLVRSLLMDGPTDRWTDGPMG